MKLLNNPLVVGALVLIAVIAVSWNFIKPLVEEYATDKISETFTNFLQPEAVTEKVMVSSGEIDLEKAGWVESPMRDPFSDIVRVPVFGPTGMGEPQPGIVGTAEDSLMLTATLIDPSGRKAAINGAIVSIGDKISRFRLIKIEPGKIWVDGPNGEESVILNGFKASAPAAGDDGNSVRR